MPHALMFSSNQFLDVFRLIWAAYLDGTYSHRCDGDVREVDDFFYCTILNTRTRIF